MDEREVGVGPHPEPWPVGDEYDQDLLANGDRRNVVDKYRYWTNQAIAEDMKKQSSGLEIAIENWQHDFNIGTIVRNANAFNVSKVHIIGKRQWNKRGAMVTNRYLEIQHHRTIEEFINYLSQSGRTAIAIDNLEGATPLSQTNLPKDAVLVFGGEGPGISQKLREACQAMVAIEQFGSTRSVNVGVASGIVIYNWMQAHFMQNQPR